jgi:hypothetical protein
MTPGTRQPQERGTETQVMQQVLEALLLFGVDCDRQNTGGFVGAGGQYVRCGQPGASDIGGMLTSGPGRGKRIEVEVKRPGFNPQKLRGGKRERERWERQIARLRQTNAQGGYGFWVTDPAQVAHAMTRINEGWRVVIDGNGWPVVTDEASD